MMQILGFLGMYSMFPIKRTVFLCTVTLVKNTVRLIGNKVLCKYAVVLVTNSSL